MAGATDNYGLVLFNGSEDYEYSQLNDNSRTVDKELKRIDDSLVKIKHAEFNHSTDLTFPSGDASWGVGTLALTANTFNNDFVAYQGVDAVKFLAAGVYLFQWTLDSDNTLPEGVVVIRDTTEDIKLFQGDLKTTKTWHPTWTGVGYVKKNAIVSFYTTNRASSFKMTSCTIKITRLFG